MIPSATRRNNVTREESGLNSVSEALRERPRRRGDRASPTIRCVLTFQVNGGFRLTTVQ